MEIPYDDPLEAEGYRPRDHRRLAVLWRLLPLLWPHRARFLLALIALCGASGIMLLYPWAVRQGVDVGMAGQTTERLDRIVALMIGVFVVNAALVWLRHYSISWLGERVVADLRVLVFDRVLALPLAWFHERRSGELVGRLASDVAVIEGVVGGELAMALRNAIQMIGAMVMLLLIDVPLTLLMLAIVPPITLTTLSFGRRLRRMTRAVQDELARVSGQVQESIGAIATVQSFAREAYEARRYRSGVEAAFGKTSRLLRWQSWFFSTAMTAGYIGLAVVIWLGGRALIRGELTAGQLTSFFLYTFIVAGALGDLAGLWGALQRAAGATDRLFAVIDTVPEIRDPEPARALPPGKGWVKLERVSFSYPGRRDRSVLTDVDLEIAPGEVVALVGPSGAGKSTILSLLHRFHDVDAGCVRFEGIDVRELALGELRRALAMVAQEPVLFSGTIRDNITTGAHRNKLWIMGVYGVYGCLSGGVGCEAFKIGRTRVTE